MCVGLAVFGKIISAQKRFDNPHVRDMRRTPPQDAQKCQISTRPTLERRNAPCLKQDRCK